MKTKNLIKTDNSAVYSIETDDYEIIWIDLIDEEGIHSIESISLFECKVILNGKLPLDIDDQILKLYKVLQDFKIYNVITSKPQRIIAVVDYLLSGIKISNANSQSKQVSIGDAIVDAIDSTYNQQFNDYKGSVCKLLEFIHLHTNISFDNLQLLVDPNFSEILDMAKRKEWDFEKLSMAASEVENKNGNSFMEEFQDHLREL